MAIALAEVSATGADLRSGAACVPFTLGPFTITPYLADHSAYDAFSLLIEAGGRSLFYTGDLRGHGRKATAFERLLADPPSPIHAILMEGTSFRNVSQCIGATATPSGAVVWSLWDGYLDQPSGTIAALISVDLCDFTGGATTNPTIPCAEVATLV